VATSGASLATGFQNFMRDVKAKNIQMVEPDAFVVGKDLATTPGKVVFRNRLVELIHYAPTTEKVRATPIVIVTPWINKFYILDLNAKKSLVKYLTDQGFSVFITSWKNPDAGMSEVRLDDYLLEGVNEVVRVASEFCKVPQGASGRLLHRRHAGVDLHGLGQQAFRRREGAGRALDAVHHADRLFPSRRHRRLHRRGLHRRARGVDGQDAATSTAAKWRPRSACCARTA
jgi:hypothetical protein